MIVLQCDRCRKQSPDAEGNRVAEDWVTTTFQRQRDRDRATQARLLLCEDCFPLLLGNEIEVRV